MKSFEQEYAYISCLKIFYENEQSLIKAREHSGGKGSSKANASHLIRNTIFYLRAVKELSESSPYVASITSRFVPSLLFQEPFRRKNGTALALICYSRRVDSSEWHNVLGMLISVMKESGPCSIQLMVAFTKNSLDRTREGKFYLMNKDITDFVIQILHRNGVDALGFIRDHCCSFSIDIDRIPNNMLRCYRHILSELIYSGKTLEPRFDNDELIKFLGGYTQDRGTSMSFDKACALPDFGESTSASSAQHSKNAHQHVYAGEMPCDSEEYSVEKLKGALLFLWKLSDKKIPSKRYKNFQRCHIKAAASQSLDNEASTSQNLDDSNSYDDNIKSLHKALRVDLEENRDSCACIVKDVPGGFDISSNSDVDASERMPISAILQGLRAEGIKVRVCRVHEKYA